MRWHIDTVMSRKQAIRKIRITASVALGVLCVLLIGLYVRSHYYLDSLRFSLNGKNSVHIQTASGRVALFTLPHVHPTRISHVPTSNHPRIDPFYKPITGGPSATEFWSPARRVSPILSYYRPPPPTPRFVIQDGTGYAWPYLTAKLPDEPIGRVRCARIEPFAFNANYASVGGHERKP